MYFPFFKLRQRSKRSAAHPQTIYSEVPKTSLVPQLPQNLPPS